MLCNRLCADSCAVTVTMYNNIERVSVSNLLQSIKRTLPARVQVMGLFDHPQFVLLKMFSSMLALMHILEKKSVEWTERQKSSLKSKVPYFKHLTKVPYRVYLMKNQMENGYFLKSIILLAKNISLMDLFCNQSQVWFQFLSYNGQITNFMGTFQSKILKLVQ